MRNRFRILAVPALVAALLAGCLGGNPTASSGKGGGAETTDGRIVAATGMAAGVRVRLVPQDFNPLAQPAFPDSLTAITDTAGRYAFTDLPPGRYDLEAVQPRDGTRLFRGGIVIGEKRSDTLPTAALARPGRLRLLWESSHRGYLFMRGTTMLHRIATTEIETPEVVLDSLPIGKLPPLYWAQSAADIGTRITDSVTILSDSTVKWGVFAAWSHHGNWSIDTTALTEGAAVTDFPFLIRLSAPGFDFAQAAPDGSDLRFSDPGGAELAYAIERWDAKAGQAEVWVRLPAIDRARKRTAFRMHWGNAGAAPRSSAPDVFGAANGYATVLHLDEAGDTAAGGYADVTGSGRNGTGIALAGAPPAPGVVGVGQALNGVDQWIEVAGDYPAGNAPRSLSMWAKAESPTVNSYLANYGSAADNASFGLWNDAGTWYAWHWGNSNDIGTTAQVDTAWHRITLDYDGATSRFYVDGNLVGSEAKLLATTPTGFALGKGYEGKPPWKGLVDEVEFSTRSRSLEWIRLAYENQKPGSALARLLPSE
jgi:hypothetical protein